jgi:hypothetical protein
MKPTLRILSSQLLERSGAQSSNIRVPRSRCSYTSIPDVLIHRLLIIRNDVVLDSSFLGPVSLLLFHSFLNPLQFSSLFLKD